MNKWLLLILMIINSKFLYFFYLMKTFSSDFKNFLRIKKELYH